MYYEPPQRPRPRRRRSILDSPALAGLLAVVLLGLAAVVFVPAFLGLDGGTAIGTQRPPSGPATSTGASVAPTFNRPTPSPGPTFVAYTVKSGDTLNSIARKFRTTGRSIAWWNRGAYPSLDPQSANYDPNTIRRGWVLVVLPDTVVDDNNPPTPSPGPTGSPSAS